jgi:hypothetical protein
MSFNLEILLVAVPSEGDKSAEIKEITSWLVTLAVNGKACGRTIALSDPFDGAQRQDCRWYIEEFVRKSPYSVKRASKVSDALRAYGKSLLNQLGLVDLVNDAFSGQAYGTRSVSISVGDGSESESTVHQLHWELLEDSSLWGVKDLQVAVRRKVTISTGHINDATTQNAFLGKERASHHPVVNVLLVVARDLSKDPRKYDDVAHILLLTSYPKSRKISFNTNTQLD